MFFLTKVTTTFRIFQLVQSEIEDDDDQNFECSTVNITANISLQEDILQAEDKMALMNKNLEAFFIKLEKKPPPPDTSFGVKYYIKPNLAPEPSSNNHHERQVTKKSHLYYSRKDIISPLLISF